MTTVVNLPALKQIIMQFAGRGSIEITPHDEQYLPELKSLLPAGTILYVAHTPKATLADIVRTAGRVRETGLRACPHIAARRVGSETELRAALMELKERDCQDILLIAGDGGSPKGPYADTLEILESRIVEKCGIAGVGVAGHPQGRDGTATERLWQALAAKQSFANRTGIAVHIVSQFGFNAQAILDWMRELRNRGISLPLQVGLAGPTPLNKLVRYALLCGIGTSLKSAINNPGLLAGMSGAVKSVDEVIVALARNLDAQDRVGLDGAHFFSFGGCVATARWVNAVRDGRFEIRADGSGFITTE